LFEPRSFDSAPVLSRESKNEGSAQDDNGGGGRAMSNHRTRANRNYVNPFVVFRCGIRKARTRFTYKNISCN